MDTHYLQSDPLLGRFFEPFLLEPLFTDHLQQLKNIVGKLVGE